MKRLGDDSSSSSSEEVLVVSVKQAPPQPLDAKLGKKLKKQKTRQPDLSLVDPQVAEHIREAVIGAIQLDGRQPVLLHIEDPDGYYTVVAYWPRTSEVGQWLLQTLEAGDQGLHSELVAAIAWPHKEDVKRAFEGLWNDNVCTLAELGEFASVTDGGEMRCNDDDNGRARILKKDLCAFLYTQYCRIYDDY